MSSIKQIGFQFGKIEVIKSVLLPFSGDGNQASLSFDISLEHRYNIDLSVVIVGCTIQVKHEPTSDVLYELMTDCVYKIDQFNELLDSENQLALPKSFEITLNSISISTTRGVMFGMLRGTYLHHAVLPIIDPSEFTKSDQ